MIAIRVITFDYYVFLLSHYVEHHPLTKDDGMENEDSRSLLLIRVSSLSNFSNTNYGMRFVIPFFYT